MYQQVWSTTFCQTPSPIETSTTKSVFLWYRFQRDVHLFLKFRITFTWTKFLEKSLLHNPDVPFSGRNESNIQVTVQPPWNQSLCTHIVRKSDFVVKCHKLKTFALLRYTDRLVGLVIRRPPRERKIPGSNPACAGIFSGSSHTSDLNIGTPVATLPGAWRYRVSTRTGRPGVSIL